MLVNTLIPISIRLHRIAFSVNGGWLAALVLLAVAGCKLPEIRNDPARHFTLERDAFAFTNELRSTYDYDAEGKWTRTPIEPMPEYSLRCFPVVRAVRQFYDHAAYDPSQAKATEEVYRAKVREIVSRSARQASLLAERVVIPGYANTREFSAAYRKLCQELCGRPVESYTQRGHWRMVLGFNRSGQVKRAEAMAERVRAGRPVIAHIVDFPGLRINHAVLLIAVETTATELRFSAYDPNDISGTLPLVFDRALRQFTFPQTKYSEGCAVDVYEVYRDALY